MQPGVPGTPMASPESQAAAARIRAAGLQRARPSAPAGPVPATHAFDLKRRLDALERMKQQKADAAAAGGPAAASGGAARPASVPRVERNDPCPCGSGKKYKKCHGVAG